MYQIEMQAIYQQHILDASQCSQLLVSDEKSDWNSKGAKMYWLKNRHF